MTVLHRFYCSYSGSNYGRWVYIQQHGFKVEAAPHICHKIPSVPPTMSQNTFIYMLALIVNQLWEHTFPYRFLIGPLKQSISKHIYSAITATFLTQISSRTADSSTRHLLSQVNLPVWTTNPPMFHNDCPYWLVWTNDFVAQKYSLIENRLLETFFWASTTYVLRNKKNWFSITHSYPEALSECTHLQLLTQVIFPSYSSVPSQQSESQIHIHLLSCQSRVTVMSCFVYKVTSDLESIDHLCINPIHRIGLIHKWSINSR